MKAEQLEILCSEFGKKIIEKVLPDTDIRKDYIKERIEGSVKSFNILHWYRRKYFRDEDTMKLINEDLFSEKKKILNDLIYHVKIRYDRVLDDDTEKFMKTVDIYIPEKVLEIGKSDTCVKEDIQKLIFIYKLQNDLKAVTLAGEH